LAGLGAHVNKCQQHGNTVIDDPEMPEHCFGLLGGLGAEFGRENLYLGSYYLITPYAPFSTCEWGRDGMDCIGEVWMTFSRCP
jgi:hypothetical protein